MTCGGRYGGKRERERWREKNIEMRKIIIISILTMIELSKETQNWREGGGKVEVTSCGWRKVEVTCGGRYGGKTKPKTKKTPPKNTQNIQYIYRKKIERRRYKIKQERYI